MTSKQKQLALFLAIEENSLEKAEQAINNGAEAQDVVVNYTAWVIERS